MKRKFNIELEIEIEPNMEKLYQGDEAICKQLEELMKDELPDTGLTYKINVTCVEV